MTEKKEKEAILDLSEKTDNLSIITSCPVCNDKYIYGVPYVHVPCKKCGSTYKTDFNQEIYTKNARRLNQKLAWNDKVTVRATDKYESSLTCMREHFIMMNCWDISEVKKETEEYKYCLECGVCYNCFTCKTCGKSFTKNPNRRKQKCPDCGESAFVRTYFTHVETSKKNDRIKLCPHCESDKIKLTRTTRKSKCHKCESKNLSEKKTNNIYIFSIKRKKSYKLENMPPKKVNI